MVETKNPLIGALEQLERDKGIKKDELIKMIESSLVSAYRKHHGRMMNVVAAIDPDTALITAHLVKRVVENVANSSEEMTVEEAKAVQPNAVVGEEVRIPISTDEFSRIAAQIAKQIIVQKIREVERTSLFDEFSDKESSLASGTVHRFVDRNIIVDLGKAEAILPVREQVRRERFNLGERMKVLVMKVERGNRGPQIMVSRSHPNLVRRLLEMEVPEIAENIVEVLDVVRDPGFRAKVAVRSHNPKVDPVGTCVGVKGSRIRPVIDELRGERIDLIPWSSEPEKYIAASIAPAKALSVSLAKDHSKNCEVLVSNDMYTQAIGRNGQNARLASKLTGWNIDLKSESQKREEAAKTLENAQKDLSGIDGVGARTAEVLIKGGWNTAERLAGANVEQLTSLQGIGEKTAEKIIESAKNELLSRKKSKAEVTVEPDLQPETKKDGENVGEEPEHTRGPSREKRRGSQSSQSEKEPGKKSESKKKHAE